MAGTLAAVTSFLLASKIGIAGSVIGAAASYIVSAAATKIYQNVLTASSEKLQSASSSGNDDDTTDNKSDKAAESESDTTMTGMVNTVSTARKPREVVSNRANGRTYSVNELRKARSHNSKRTAIYRHAGIRPARRGSNRRHRHAGHAGPWHGPYHHSVHHAHANRHQSADRHVQSE